MASNEQIGAITPLHIKIALHYSNPQGPEADACLGHDIDAVARVFREFTESGLLEITDDGTLWKATDGMHRYVEALCRVPLPVKQPVKSLESISKLDSALKKGKKYIGDHTIKTRNSKISATIAEYLLTTPKAKL